MTHTQNQIVLKHMRERGSITALIAMKRYGIYRLASRVWDLEKAGHRILHTMISRGGKRYAAYSLVEYVRKAA